MRTSCLAVVVPILLLVGSGTPAGAQTGSDCQPSPTDLCLLDDRFQVSVDWQDQATNPFHLAGRPLTGEGQGVELPGDDQFDAGYFWFFEPDDVELVVRMIDGRQANGHFWVFYGATTNVEYTIRVVDTETRREVQYFNPQGQFGGGSDTRAFDESPSGGNLRSNSTTAVRKAVFRPKESLPSCADPAVACVQNGRVAIESLFTNPFDPGATPRAGLPVVTTSTSAILYHVGAANPETVIKVLDARSVNDRFWIFASVATLPGTEVTVTDLQTGNARVFQSDPDTGLLAVGDRQGFFPDPPAGAWLETPALPGFRFKVRVTGGGGVVATRQEADCIPETLCISGALPGRSELFLRLVGPKPNGFLWPNIVKFSTSQIEVWIEQLSTGQINYYELDAAGPGSSELAGFFDRTGFVP